MLKCSCIVENSRWRTTESGNNFVLACQNDSLRLQLVLLCYFILCYYYYYITGTHCAVRSSTKQPAKTTGDRGPEVVMASCETHVHSTIASCGISASYYRPGISRLFLELFVCPLFGPMSSVTFGFSAFHSAFTSAMWVSEDWGWIRDGPSEFWLEILSPGLISSLFTLQTNLSLILGGHILQAHSIEASGLFDS